jgi:hypothetical protein
MFSRDCGQAAGDDPGAGEQLPGRELASPISTKGDRFVRPLWALRLAMKIIRLSIAIDLFHTSGAIPNACHKKES